MRAIVKDDTGVEFALEWHMGVVTDIGTPGPRNTPIKLKADIPAMKIPVTGSVETHSNAMEAARLSLQDQTQVAVRIEVRRKHTVDPSLPIEKLGPTEKFRRVVEMATKNDPEFDKLLNRAESDAKRDVAGPDRPDNQVVQANREDWAYAAAVATVNLAFEILTQWKTGSPGRRFYPTDIKHLAGLLLRAADEAQHKTFGHTDRADRSHTRARGATRTALTGNPAPLGDQEHPARPENPEWDTWGDRLGHTAATLLAIANDLHHQPSANQETAA